MNIPNVISIDHKGLHPALTVLLILLCFFVELIAYAIVSLPLYTSMDQECDPEKQLILNKQLGNQKNTDHIYATDHLYLGNFTEALKYAEKMIASDKEHMALSGLFNKARCEFFLGDHKAFRQTANQYQGALSNCNKIKQKTKEAYKKISIVLDLMYAISEEDTKKIDRIRNSVEVWNTSKASVGFLNYIKGISAYKVGDKEEAICKFMYVKDNCSKTVFADFSNDYLSSLK